MPNLTDAQEKFVQELIKGKSQREAYKIAYPGSNKWKDNAVDVRASKLFNSDKVMQRYTELHDRLIKEAEDECIVSAKEVLRELKRIGFADIKDFISFRTEKTIVGHDEETGEPLFGYAPVIEMIDSNDVDGRAIQEVSLSAKGTFSFKLHDKMSALEKLGKHLGMFADNVKISGTINNPYASLTEDDLLSLARGGEDDAD